MSKSLTLRLSAKGLLEVDSLTTALRIQNSFENECPESSFSVSVDFDAFVDVAELPDYVLQDPCTMKFSDLPRNMQIMIKVGIPVTLTNKEFCLSWFSETCAPVMEPNDYFGEYNA